MLRHRAQLYCTGRVSSKAGFELAEQPSKGLQTAVSATALSIVVVIVAIETRLCNV